MFQNPFWKETELTTTAPPETLYHYTNRAGLFGILSSFTIRASSSQFLNDSSEFTYSTQLIAKIARNLKQQSTDWFEQQLLDQAVNLHNASGLKKQVFVFSLSEHGDLLSQWRAYGRPGDAYALGFSSDVLRSALSDQRILLASCLYERSAQVAKIRTMLEVALRSFRSKGFLPADAQKRPLPPDLAQAIGDVNLAFVQAAALVKHPSFEEEREWRLIRIGPDRQLSFRLGRFFIVPYIELPISTAISKNVLKEIVIGPSPQSMSDTASLNWLLNERGVSGAVIHSSVTPYRGFE